MTRKSCLLGKGYSVMDSLYSRCLFKEYLWQEELKSSISWGIGAHQCCPGLKLTEEHIYIHTAWISHKLIVCPGMWLSLPLFLFLEVFAGTTKRERLTWAVGAAIYPLPLPHCVALGKSCNYTGTLFPSPEMRTINSSSLTLGFLWRLKTATDSAFLLRAFLSKKPH